MVDFPSVSILKGKSTVAAFPLLTFEQPCELARDQGMLFESLAPIQKLSIIGASFTPYLDVVGDGCLAV